MHNGRRRRRRRMWDNLPERHPVMWKKITAAAHKSVEDGKVERNVYEALAQQFNDTHYSSMVVLPPFGNK